MRENIRSLRSMWDIALAVVLAFACYVLLAWLVIDRWRVMPLGRARILEIKAFLDDRTSGAVAPSGDVYLLGSSVAVEGLDGSIIDAMLPAGRRCYNLAWTAGRPRVWRLLLPSVLSANPAAVVLCVDLSATTNSLPVPLDILALAAWWDFVPESELAELRSEFTGEECDVLASSSLRQLVTLRSLPPAALDGYVREVSRPDLRYDSYATNFKAPWVRQRVVPAAAMQRGIQGQKENRRRYSAENVAESLEMLQAVVDRLRVGDCRTMIVFTPVHPGLNDGSEGSLVALVRDALARLAERNRVAFLDHSEVLEADQFSDPLHPFEPGRRAWSKTLGRAIAENLTMSE